MFFVFVLFAFFQDVFFVFVLLLVVFFVLNHYIIYVSFAFSFVVVVFCFFALVLWKFEGPQKEKRRKMDILTRTVSTGVFTNSVFFLFGVL